MTTTTLKAQYAGTCALCLAAIGRGNRIVMVARKACHEGCYDRATVEQGTTQPTYMSEAEWTASVAATTEIRVRYAALTSVVPAAAPTSARSGLITEEREDRGDYSHHFRGR